MDPTSHRDLVNSLYSIVGASPQNTTKDLSTGVFLSKIAGQNAETSPPTPKSIGNVENLTGKYQTQGKRIYDLLSAVEYTRRSMLPEQFKTEGNFEDQYYTLKNRMTLIYKEKTPLELLTIKLDPHVEFEQLEALEKAFHGQLTKNHGNISVIGAGEPVNIKTLQVMKLAADHYRADDADNQVSFTLSNFSLPHGIDELINQISGWAH